jgi:hypothetical protein
VREIARSAVSDKAARHIGECFRKPKIRKHIPANGLINVPRQTLTKANSACGSENCRAADDLNLAVRGNPDEGLQPMGGCRPTVSTDDEPIGTPHSN